MKRLMMTLLLLSAGAHAQDIRTIIGRQNVSEAQRSDGSNIGGGKLYSSIINWCDDSTIILDEAKEEALFMLGMNNDKFGAVRTLYQGLLSALSSIAGEDVNYDNSITYKAISRGIGLAQRLGVPQIIAGNFKNTSDAKINEIISFMSFYYDFVKKSSQNLDKKFFVPYYSRVNCRNCPGAPEVRIEDVERELIAYTTGQIEDWRSHFVKTKSQTEGYYSTIETVTVLKGLAYLTTETATDLNESLFAKAYECQSKKLVNLSKKIHYILSNRENNFMDRIRLNQFIISTDDILEGIKQKNCFIK